MAEVHIGQTRLCLCFLRKCQPCVFLSLRQLRLKLRHLITQVVLSSLTSPSSSFLLNFTNMNTSRRIVRQDESILRQTEMAAKKGAKTKAQTPQKRAKTTPELEEAHSDSSEVSSRSPEGPPENTRVFYAQAQRPTWERETARQIYRFIEIVLAFICLCIAVAVALVVATAVNDLAKAYFSSFTTWEVSR